MKKPKKPSAIDPEKVKIVRGYFLQGASADDVIERITKDWGSKNPRDYIDAVFEAFAQTAAEDEMVARGWCLESARDLYCKMVECGDFAGALNALKEIAKLAKMPKPIQQPAHETADLGALLKVI